VSPINKSGDTMSGSLNLGSNDVLSAGNIQMAASKTLSLSGNSVDPTGLVSTDKGKTWFNTATKQIKYWDGDSTQVVGAVGASLTSLNNQTGTTQTLAVPGTSGTAPSWSSAANAHTLNIPLASTPSVTAGLLSNSDYNTLNSKVSGVTSGSGVTVSTTGNLATVSLSAAGTAGSYAKVTTDAYGRVTAGTTLSAADIPPLPASLITSGTLNTAQLPTTGTVGTFAKVTTDAYGRVSAGTTLASSDITSSLGFTPINKAGDSITGILSLSANGLVAGTNQLVLANGNVGIGTTAPNKLLQISSSNTNDTSLALTNTSVGGHDWQIGSLGSAGGAGKLSFYDNTAGQTRLTFDGVGNIGIGTLSPSNKLDVIGHIGAFSGYAVGSYLVPYSSPVFKSGLGMNLKYDGTNWNTLSDTNNNGAGAVLTDFGGNISIYTLPSTGSVTRTISDVTINSSYTRMTITNSGNVGIGTAAPNGALQVRPGTDINLQTKAGFADATAVSLNAANDANNAQVPLEIRASKTNFAVGNVGIGSSAPTAALDVNGTIKGNTPAVAAYSETGQTTTTRNAWVTSTAVQVTVPVTGKYLVQASARAYPIGAADNWWKARVYNQTQGTQACVFLGFGYAGTGGFSKGDGTASQTTIASFNAGDVVVLQFSINGGDTGSVYLVGDGNGGSSLSLLRVSN